jgi:hypothetical protein
VTKRNYFQSAIILLVSLWLVHYLLKLDWVESVLLILLAIICVIHTMDIRDDIRKKLWEKRQREKRLRDNP